MNILDVFPQITDNILFNNADKNKLKKLLLEESDDIVLKKFSPYEIILSPDIKTVPIGIVVNGIIEITSAAQKHKVILKTAGSGSIFGIANLYATQSEFPSQITAKTDSEILIINPDLFRRIIESDPVITKNYLYLVLSERERFSRPVIITTNLMLDELNNRYDERICSRLCNKRNTNLIFIDGEDLRRTK